VKRALVILGSLAVAPGAPGGDPPATACQGFEPPRAERPALPTYPVTLQRARVSGEAIHEAVLDREGKLLDLKLVEVSFFSFAPAAEAAIRDTGYRPATLEGNPVAARWRIITPFGGEGRRLAVLPRNRLWVFVPAGENRNARWQLAGWVKRVAMEIQLASTSKPAAVLAVDRSGTERGLFSLPAGSKPETRTVVRTGSAFEKPGEYIVELRQDGQSVAETRFTVAPDWKAAVVNACQP
jgi:Gram-negative bacterial TonB protein C-terminal